MVFGIVGRDAEVASLQAFVGDAGRIGAALVLQGDAGIGKSTLWDATVDYARADRTSSFSRRGRPRPTAF
jgi:hypothetical protein